MDKILKQRYDRSRKIIPLRLSVKEQIFLERMMKDEDWENASGFIRYKLFREMEQTNFRKMIRRADNDDIQIIMKTLLDNLSREIGYLNYRFNYELERLEENQGKFTERMAKKILWTMGQYRKNVMERTSYVLSDCEDILRSIGLKIEREQEESVRYAPDCVIDKARKDWNDTTSPEALEGVRRDFEEFHKKYDKQWKK